MRMRLNVEDTVRRHRRRVDRRHHINFRDELFFLAGLLRTLTQLVFRFSRRRNRILKTLYDAKTGARQITRLRLFELLAWTVLRWAAGIILAYLIFLAFHIEIGLLDTLFVVAMFNIAGVLPIQTFGGFGLTEGALALALMALAMPPSDAIASALVMRTTWFLLTALAGLILMPIFSSR